MNLLMMILALVQPSNFVQATWDFVDFEYFGKKYTHIQLDALLGPKNVLVFGSVATANNSALPADGSCFPQPDESWFCSIRLHQLSILMIPELDGTGVIQFSDADGNILHTSTIQRR